jgi:hypothetical protein
MGVKEKQQIQETKIKEEQYIIKINELTRMNEEKSLTLNNFIEKYNKIEQERV